MESCNTKSSLDLPLESLSLQPFLQSLHKEQWQEVRLGEVVEMNNGKARPKNYGDHPIYGGNGILGYGNQYNCDSETIIVGRVGAYCGCVYYEKQPIWVSDNAIIVKAKSENNIKFLYYVLKSMKLNDYALGSSHPLLTQNLLNTLQVEIPKDITTQQKIAEILSSFDDKIDLLHRQNKTLESLALTLFRHYFIDNPNRSEWELGKLGDYIEIFDNKRVPLSKLQRDKMKTGNLYPYYGAANIMDYVNDFIFNGEYILMGEDGSVETEDGYPILQFASGKFWVNNHAHIFKAKQPYNDFFILNFLKSTNISHIVTGAVQPKINQENLKSIPFPIFSQQLVRGFIETTNVCFDKINQNKKQIQNLQAMRDMLLKAIFA